MDEEDTRDLKDHSRPFFQRQYGQIGIYLDAYDAIPARGVIVGSKHCFMMAVLDRLYEELCTADLSEIKGRLEAKKVLRGIILEFPHKGLILVVSCNTVAALEDLWNLHTENKLTSIVQNVLVNKQTLRVVGAAKLELSAKIWEDEYLAYRDELEELQNSVVDITTKERDLEYLLRARQFQRNIIQSIGEFRDAESQIERGLGEAILSLKKVIPETTRTINNISEFFKIMKMAQAQHKYDKPPASLNIYKTLLVKLLLSFESFQVNVCHPMAQIRAACEKPNQQDLKEKIVSTCDNALTLLQTENKITNISHATWRAKILPREQGLFLGAFSVMSMAVEKLTDIDHDFDEYFLEYPDNVRDHNLEA